MVPAVPGLIGVGIDVIGVFFLVRFDGFLGFRDRVVISALVIIIIGIILLGVLNRLSGIIRFRARIGVVSRRFYR